MSRCVFCDISTTGAQRIGKSMICNNCLKDLKKALNEVGERSTLSHGVKRAD
jgi:hypothetical protein